jgi:SEC-C motif-containing protein
MEIKQIEAGQPKDDAGRIVFHARYRADGKDIDHWEQSFFEKENGEWRFLDATGLKPGTYRREEPKIGRNDPCSCGSGKKYKKCCGI